MADLIDRQAAIEETWKEPSYTDPLNVLTELRDRIKDLPSAQPERKKGRWILSDDRDWKTCSECGVDVDVSMGTGVYVGVDAVDELYFCPNCGADMRGENE